MRLELLGGAGLGLLGGVEGTRRVMVEPPRGTGALEIGLELLGATGLMLGRTELVRE